MILKRNTVNSFELKMQRFYKKYINIDSDTKTTDFENQQDI